MAHGPRKSDFFASSFCWYKQTFLYLYPGGEGREDVGSGGGALKGGPHRGSLGESAGLYK